MKRFVRITLSALAMLATMLVAALLTVRIALHTGEVTIPDFSSLSVGEATDSALRHGLDLNIENKFYSTTVPAGRILSQAPSPGSRVRKGWQVRVTESLGPQQVTIPDVTGQTVRAASMDLRRDALDLGTLAHLDTPGDPDIVLAQTPPPDAGVDQPRVSLLLSSAASGASSAFVLPSFVGLNDHDASRQAAMLGLRTSLVGQTTDSAAAPTSLPSGAHPGPNGTMVDASGEPIAIPAAATAAPAVPAAPSGPVLSQTPGAGFRANKGDTVKLTFAHITMAAPPPAAAAPQALSTPTGTAIAPPPPAGARPAIRSTARPSLGVPGAPPSPTATH
jgi:beta-lactam-binding protein with PASTA domain